MASGQCKFVGCGAIVRTESLRKRKVEGSSTWVGRKRRLWTQVEDHILVDYVRKHGERNWGSVQRVTGLTRTGKSCRLRWTDQLHPGLNKGPFTLAEENLIADLQSQVGNKWTIISAFLPGRTDNAIKNYWYNRCKKHKMAGLLYEKGTSSCDTWTNGFKLNQQSLSPDSVPSFESPMSRESFSSLYRLPATYVLKPEQLELSSIQHVGAPRGFPLGSFDAISYSSSPAENFLSKAPSEGWFFEEPYGLCPCNMQQDDLVNGLIASLAECDDGLVDPVQTEGDIVDLWLKSFSSDESLDQERICQEAVCADGGIGNTIAATTTDVIAELPAWLNSPSLDEFLDQQSICEDTLCADDETIDSVAATEESATCFNSTGCENGGTMIENGVVDEPLCWVNSPTMDNCLYQEPLCQDLVSYADYGAFAATTESYVPSYGWGETSDFWSTPFITQIQMDC